MLQAAVRMMRKLWVLGSLVLFAGNLSAHDAANLELIQKLSPYEVADEAMILNGKYLFYSSSRFEVTDPYILWIYDTSKSKVIKSIELQHSIRYMMAKDDSTIYVGGKTIEPWTSFITKVTVDSAENFQINTQKIPNEQLVDHMTWYSKSMLLADPGSQQIFALNQKSGLKSAVQGVSNPGPMAVVNGKLIILERNAHTPGDENILKVDFKTKNMSSVWPQREGIGQGMTRLEPVTGTTLVAVNEWDANKILVIDTESMKIVKELPLEGQPEGIAGFGKCIVASSLQKRYLALFHTSPEVGSEPLATWSFEGAGIHLSSARTLETMGDSNEISVFIRSAIPCTSHCGDNTQSSMYKLSAQHPALKMCF